MRVIFVGGIHGCGKSSFCRVIAPALTAEHHTAGELIRYEGCVTGTSDKSVANVDLNQRLLIQALGRLSSEVTMLLLDGHYTLVDRQRKFERVSVEVFRAIQPSVLLLITEDPLLIAERLMKRDNRVYTPAFLKEHSEAERSAASYISSVLGVPLFELQSPPFAENATVLAETVHFILEAIHEDPA